MKIMGFKVQGSDISMNKNIENCKDWELSFSWSEEKNIKDATILLSHQQLKAITKKLKRQKKKITNL